MHTVHEKDVGGSNEGPWSNNHDRDVYWYEQGKEHQNPSSYTSSWMNKITTMMFLMCFFILFFVVISSIQVHQSNKILAEISDSKEVEITYEQ